MMQHCKDQLRLKFTILILIRPLLINVPSHTSIVDKDCSAAEFKCTSGQCVSAMMRCDGHPDCSDRSDEESCSNAPVCPTKHRCPQSKECLVQEWICDGDQDCKDGTDEKVNVLN